MSTRRWWCCTNTYKSRSIPALSCGWSARHSSHCQSPPADLNGRSHQLLHLLHAFSGREMLIWLLSIWLTRPQQVTHWSKCRGLFKSVQLKIEHINLRFQMHENTLISTFLMSSRVWISGLSPPWTQRNCWFMRAARGRQSKASMQASYTRSVYLILPN